MLIDKHKRSVNYLRIAVTDKCNLRCFYCMPEEGISFVKNSELLSYEEIIRFAKIVAAQGVNKIRITGGEPFLRRDIMSLFRGLSAIDGIDKIAVTTNGTETGAHLEELISLGVVRFNLSLDSLDPARFFEITRRDYFDKVMDFYRKIVDKKLDVKVNAVVMANRNIDDIIPMVNLAEKDNVSIRFIEEMPFNGNADYQPELEWDHKRILAHIEDHFGKAIKLQDPQGATALEYQIEGFVGTFGIIPAYSRSFCGSCNRLRLTPTGTIKTCLYDDGVFNVLKMMRADATDEELLLAVEQAIGSKAKDGFEAERNRLSSGFTMESMATIGG